MHKSISFSECLSLLLDALAISSSRLAKGINVDSSLVNRWLNGKRVPPYSSNHIENIAEYISNSNINSFQKQRLSELMLAIEPTICPELPIKEKIKKILSEAQGFSIEHRMKDAKNQQMVQFINYNLLESSTQQSPFMDQQTFPNRAEIIDEPQIQATISSKVIFGTRNIMLAALSLIEDAVRSGLKKPSTIFISLNNNNSMTLDFPDLLKQGQHYLLQALEQGWEVVFLVRLNYDMDRSASFLNLIQPMLEINRFKPYYYKNYDMFTTGKEVISIPQIGTLSAFPSEAYSSADRAFYCKDPLAINIITDYFKSLISRNAHPLVTYYSSASSEEFGMFFVKNETCPGSRFLYKDGFSMLTIPYGLFKNMLIRKGFQGAALENSLEFYTKRFEGFMENIMHYEYFDIYTFDSIRHLVEQRTFCIYSQYGITPVELEDVEIIQLLQNIIDLLVKYDKYHIAFTNPIPNSTYHYSSFFWLIKDRHSVMLASYMPFTYQSKARFSMDEPMLAHAFTKHFKDLWQEIPPLNKEKENVIKLLKSKIEYIKQRNTAN